MEVVGRIASLLALADAPPFLVTQANRRPSGARPGREQLSLVSKFQNQQQTYSVCRPGCLLIEGANLAASDGRVLLGLKLRGMDVNLLEAALEAMEHSLQLRPGALRTVPIGRGRSYVVIFRGGHGYVGRVLTSGAFETLNPRQGLSP